MYEAIFSTQNTNAITPIDNQEGLQNNSQEALLTTSDDIERASGVFESEYTEHNINSLESSGEVGTFLADVYRVALEDSPKLAHVQIRTGGKNTNYTLNYTGGFARHKDINPNDEYTVDVNTDDGFEHYSHLLETRRSAVEATALKMGVKANEIDAETLAGFIFAHELGHIVDYMQNAPTRAEKDARRKRDLETLPVPGLDPTQLQSYLNRPVSQSYFADNQSRLAELGIQSMEELIKAQELGYRSMETEDIPDQFAVKVMGRVKSGKAESDLSQQHVEDARNAIREIYA